MAVESERAFASASKMMRGEFCCGCRCNGEQTRQTAPRNSVKCIYHRNFGQPFMRFPRRTRQCAGKGGAIRDCMIGGHAVLVAACRNVVLRLRIGGAKAVTANASMAATSLQICAYSRADPCAACDICFEPPPLRPEFLLDSGDGMIDRLERALFVAKSRRGLLSSILRPFQRLWLTNGKA
jgi:hypothetical protein